MVLIDTKKRLTDAMAMEKEYRKLRLDWEAKTAFGYHDKLKSFGFSDTVEYEKAKRDYYLKTSGIKIKYINASGLSREEKDALDNLTESLFVISQDNILVYTGTESVIDNAYCSKNNIPVYKIGYPGRCDVVSGELDIAFALIIRRGGMGNYLADKLVEELDSLGLGCKNKAGNILFNNNKVGGFAKKETGISDFTIYYWYVSFGEDPEKVSEISKEAKGFDATGIPSVSKITKENLIARTIEWLQ